MPVFSAARGSEREWVIFELDESYVKTTWLPELLAQSFAEASGARDVRVEVRNVGAAGMTLMAWPEVKETETRPPDASAGLFPRAVQRPPDAARGDFRWTLNVWHAGGPLEDIVVSSRVRNFAVAALLIALIAAAAWERTRAAARSRALAARELAFVAGVSHELRTPLAAIRGAGHNLRTNLVSDAAKVHAYGDLIVQRADQLTAMLEQVLSVASLRRVSDAKTVVRMSIAGVIRDAVRMTAHMTASAGCRVDVDVPDDLPSVSGDPAALRRVFENLVVNAATHGASGGWIGITACADAAPAGTIEVSVADRGPGVPSYERSRIWEPFVRGTESGLGPHRGFGLGLSLVREIVERHGGTVALTSDAGAGATFIVRLPRAAEQPS
jgi:signal transduction histidine kinase